MAELELLVRIIERAPNVPDLLKGYALRQIEDAVLTGTGPTRGGGELSPGHISTTECRLIRRIVFASGGHGPAAVSRFDAELLFRFKDATLGKANAAGMDETVRRWRRQLPEGFRPENAQLNHGRVEELEAFIADNRENIGRFMRDGQRNSSSAESVRSRVRPQEGRRGCTDYTAKAAAGDL